MKKFIVLLVFLFLAGTAWAELPLPPPPPERPPHAETSNIVVIWDTSDQPVAYVVPSQGNGIYSWPDGELLGYFLTVTVPEDLGK